MKVKVKFFALVRELTGKREEIVDLDDHATVRVLLGKLVKEYGKRFDEYLFDPVSKQPRGHLQFLIDGRNIVLMQGSIQPCKRDVVSQFSRQSAAANNYCHDGL